MKILKRIKTLFIHKIVEKKLKMRNFTNPVDPNMVYLNRNFNIILQLHPRVTSYSEFITLYNCTFFSFGNVIEIGSYLSYSSIIMASAFNKKKDRKLYAIDPFDREKGWENGSSDDWIYKECSQLEFARKVIGQCELNNSIELIRGYSNHVIGKFENVSNIGLIFIDGDHSYEGCESDLKLYAPKLSKEGYLLLHDYNSAGHPGVKKAVDNFLTKNVNYEIQFVVDSLLVLKKR